MTNYIKIDADTLLRDYIWNATRYSIGRKSVVALNLRDYAELIIANRDKFTPDLLKHFAQDIRNEINDQLRWFKNIEMLSKGKGQFDAYSCIMKHLSDSQLTPRDASKFAWRVNIDLGWATTTPLEEKLLPYETFGRDIDIEKAVQLAEVIDNLWTVSTNFGGKVEEHLCIMTYEALSDTKPVEMRFHPLERLSLWLKDKYIVSYVSKNVW